MYVPLKLTESTKPKCRGGLHLLRPYETGRRIRAYRDVLAACLRKRNPPRHDRFAPFYQNYLEILKPHLSGMFLKALPVKKPGQTGLF